jgi:prepilin-type processing-associated H-X9-DG protein/prepilin-type N-terminal cleavage/methylation domain-containing protein
MRRKRAFTLVELLVVLFIISALMGILLPALSRAGQHARSVVCQSNIRQLYLANTGYAAENNGFYVRAASDIWVDVGSQKGGFHRWHGVRDNANEPFDPLKGPLKNYLADGKVKQCPGIVKFVEDVTENAFEAGCGGYGYNSIGVGSRTYQLGNWDEAMRSSMKTTEIKQPYKKVMFTDTAYMQGDKGKYIIEYSFCESPHFVFFNGISIVEMGRPIPSIHFRHLKRANVVWCDGHVSCEEFAFSKLTEVELDQFLIGWFGPKDNALFRP